MGGRLLFEVPADEIRWGKTKYEHIPHLFVTAKNHVLSFNDDEDLVEGKYSADFRKVTSDEIFDGKSEHATRDFFLDIAKKISDDYEQDYGDKEFDKILEETKSYLLRNSFLGQEKSGMNVLEMLADYQKKLDDRIAKSNAGTENTGLASSEEQKNYERDLLIKEKVDAYQKTFKEHFNGSLKIDEETEKRLKEERKNLVEPKVRKGKWIEKNNALFPHEPSPNDIIQGMELKNSGMLAGLVSMAKNHPEKIREMMKDNEDGTVTIRFFDRDENNKPKPVYVQVNKTANNYGGRTDIYAGSSLWVQMLEKGCAKFANEVLSKKEEYKDISDKLSNGFEATEHVTTDMFLNAIDENHTYVKTGAMIGASDENMKKYFEKGAAKRKKYTVAEGDLYNFYSQNVMKKGENISVAINADNNSALAKYAKKLGFEPGASYNVNKVLTRRVGGELRAYVQLRDASGYPPFDYGGLNGDVMYKHSESAGEMYADAPYIPDSYFRKENRGNESKGYFNIELKDFQKVFNSFSGIEKGTLEKYNAMVKTWDQPEKHNFLDTSEKQKDYRNYKYNVDNNLKKYLGNAEAFKETFKLVKDIAEDLSSNNDFFAFDNSNAFNHMYNSTMELYKTMKMEMKKLQKNPGALISNMTMIEEQLKDAGVKANAYGLMKKEKMASEIKAGKKVSMRAIHRFTDAINLERLANGKEPIKPSKEHIAERMTLMVHDINQRCNMMEKGQEIKGQKKSIAEIKEAAETINLFLDKNPKVVKDGKIKGKSIAELRANIEKLGNTKENVFEGKKKDSNAPTMIQ